MSSKFQKNDVFFQIIYDIFESGITLSDKALIIDIEKFQLLITSAEQTGQELV